jgi:hypothetical protein
MWQSHQSWARISSSQACEMFQSSCTSWSSNTIAVDSTDSSQRIDGSVQLSR